MSGTALLGRIAEELISRFGDHEFDEDVTCARDAYTKRRGRVFEEDEQWENFTRAFLEWYVCERPWRETGKSPALIVAGDEPDQARASAMRALATSQRSLVEICATDKNGLEVTDLVGGAMFSIQEERSLVGMTPGDVVELRLFGYEGQVSMGRTFIFHPHGTLPAIRTVIDAMQPKGATRADIIDHVASLRSCSQSYRHVSPIRIYESNGLLEGVS